MSPWAARQQLGPFELISHTGAGGMGEVWKARDTRLKAIDERDAFMLWGLRLFVGRDLRSSPRWPALMRKMNLPEA
jgi:hypothetical protein